MTRSQAQLFVFFTFCACSLGACGYQEMRDGAFAVIAVYTLVCISPPDDDDDDQADEEPEPGCYTLEDVRAHRWN